MTSLPLSDSYDPAGYRPRIAILGCGWLGLPLARAFNHDNYLVRGTTTRRTQLAALSRFGIQPYLLQLKLTDSYQQADLLDDLLTGVDTLILNVPPRTTPRGTYPALLQPVAAAAARVGLPRLVFVSSTGVYPDEPRPMTEADALAAPDAASELLQAEYVFGQGPWQTTVLRLGGLFGPARPPGLFMRPGSTPAAPEAPVNLLHLTDAVGVIQAVIDQGAWGHTLNVCAGQHPTRRVFYTAATAALSLDPPTFQADDHAGGKLIRTDALHRALFYQFRHDDPLTGLKGSELGARS